MVFVVALKIEAGVLIKKYDLKNIEDNYFDIFTNKNIILIISGIGSMNSSMATTYVLNKYPQTNKIINFGGAGAVQKIQIGSMSIVKSFIFNNKKYMIGSKGLTMTCSDIPIYNQTIKTDLVDMESYGFYLACKKFQQKQFFIVKVVTDHCENIEYVTSLRQNEQSILGFDWDSLGN